MNGNLVLGDACGVQSNVGGGVVDGSEIDRAGDTRAGLRAQAVSVGVGRLPGDGASG